MDFLRFLEALTDSGAEFVIVNGVAARLYGGTRLTHDVDIVPKADPKTWPALIEVIASHGGEPRIPEKIETIKQFDRVQTWIAEKGMLALSFHSSDGETAVDLLVSESNRFDTLKANAACVSLRGRRFYVAAVDDLIEMKRRAGREQDLLDIKELESIRRRATRS